MTFKELNISEPVLKALEEKEYSTPTPIQEQAIPVAIVGKDLLGIAQTGTGKTAAFAIPIIEQLRDEQRDKKSKRPIRVLVLTPTRELALQIDESFEDYGKYTNLKHTVIFGGVRQKPQTDRLAHGTDILIATPGRLLDLIGQGFINLKTVTHFVLDEADRMLDMGFIHDIKRILPMLPAKRQTMLFSATMPKEIVEISKSILKEPQRVEAAPVASTVETIEQLFYFVDRKRKIDLLYTLIMEYKESSILIFSRTKHGADKISRTLGKRGIKCEAIHGNKSQNARQTALNNFKSGKSNIIVATDIAARGIDIQNLGLVINYDMPDVAETYVHRIGRTGRAGNSGLALSFCTEEEKQMFKSIQKLTGRTIPAKKVNFETEGSRVESVPEESIDNLQNNNKKAPSKGKSGRETDHRGSRGKENKEGRGEQRGGAQKRGKKKSEETSDRNLNGEERVSKVANRGSERAPKESNAIEETQRPAKKWNKFKAERERQRMANRAANSKKRNKFSRSDSRNEKSTF
jgi:ATP-dependent RNA helicase RhlE